MRAMVGAWPRVLVVGACVGLAGGCSSSDESDEAAATGGAGGSTGAGGSSTGGSATGGGIGSAGSPATGGSGAEAGSGGSGGGDDTGGSTASGGEPGSGGTAGFPVGGQCDYEPIAGTATIVAIEDAPDDYNCPSGGIRVTFDFTPEDPNPAHPQDSGQRLTVLGGPNPPPTCLAEAGITVGASFPARRLDIIRGTCTPTLYEVNIANFSACELQCYAA